MSASDLPPRFHGPAWPAELPPGLPLDVLIAERVLGETVVADPTKARGAALRGAALGAAGEGSREVPHYSTDLAAAWAVVEHVRPYVFELRLYADGWYCRLCWRDESWQTYEARGGGTRADGAYHAGRFPALAICYAALGAAVYR